MDFYRFIRLLMTHTVTLHYTQSLLSSFFNLFFIYFTVAYVALVFVLNCNRRVTNVSMMMMKSNVTYAYHMHYQSEGIRIVDQ